MLIDLFIVSFTHICCSHEDPHHILVSILLVLQFICILEPVCHTTIFKVKPLLMVDKMCMVQVVFAFRGYSSNRKQLHELIFGEKNLLQIAKIEC